MDENVMEVPAATDGRGQGCLAKGVSRVVDICPEDRPKEWPFSGVVPLSQPLHLPGKVQDRGHLEVFTRHSWDPTQGHSTSATVCNLVDQAKSTWTPYYSASCEGTESSSEANLSSLSFTCNFVSSHGPILWGLYFGWYISGTYTFLWICQLSLLFINKSKGYLFWYYTVRMAVRPHTKPHTKSNLPKFRLLWINIDSCIPRNDIHQVLNWCYHQYFW